MGLEKQIGELIIALSGMKDDYESMLRFSQDPFRTYVTDMSFPISDRFEVWTEWCRKKLYSNLVGDNHLDTISQMVVDGDPVRYRLYRTYDWVFFLDPFQQDARIREKYARSVDQFKELLIQANFGNYQHQG